MSHEESGSRGWMFLYELLSGALSMRIGGVECGRETGALLTRCFELKHCTREWRPSDEARPSKAMQLLMAAATFPDYAAQHLPGIPLAPQGQLQQVCGI